MGTHFSSGVTNVHADNQLGALRTMDPTQYHMWFDDFDNYTAAQWVVTETQAGATQAAITGDGGLLALVNSASDDDLNSLQWAGTSGGAIETFKWVSTKDMLIKCRWKCSEATQSDVLIGLAITDTSPLATLPSDGIFFYKADGAATIITSARKDGTSTSITTATLAADTFIETCFAWTASDGIWRVYADNVLVGQSTVTTNMPDDEEVTVTIAVQNGDGNARTLTVDYLMIAKAR